MFKDFDVAIACEDMIPLRPAASPRGTPPPPPPPIRSSTRSASSIYSQESMCAAVRKENHEARSPLQRGRSLHRVGDVSPPLPSGLGSSAASPSSALYGGFLSDDEEFFFTASPEEMDHSIFEPQPDLLGYMNLAELLESAVACTRSSYGFRGHRDTFSLLGGHKPCHLDLPLAVFRRLLLYLDFPTYRSLRLTCRCWSAAVSCVRPPKLSAVFFLPAEVLQMIYHYLAPVDFNSARHTCRFWMLASLDYGLLAEMLRRGGWWEAARADRVVNEGGALNGVNNEEWVLSKRISTECVLRHDWTGGGFVDRQSGSRSGQCDLPSTDPRPLREHLVLASEIDFADLVNGYEAAHGVSAIRATFSVCGRYLLVVYDCNIDLYFIGSSWSSLTCRSQSKSHIKKISRIVCPYRVRAVSMDTSSQQLGVAALLDNRVGLFCELQERRCATETQSPESYPLEATSSILRKKQAATAGSQLLGEEQASVCSPISSQSSWARYDHSNPEPISMATSQPGIAFEAGPQTLYHNLCSRYDPPASVAICPQRRCVAFGCSSGIELHWIDAVISQPFNRWFPLAVPSDFLYFLPGREGIDAKWKLRLISSKAPPMNKESDNLRYSKVGDGPWYEDHWWRDPGGWDELRTEKQCFYYQIVPVGDGRHLLFTDAVTSELFLGLDDPSTVGPARFEKRFLLEGPKSGKSVVPRVYRAAAEMRWGLRVAVGFGDEVWCFGVPADWFFGEDELFRSKSDGLEVDEEVEDQEAITIRGVKVGEVDGLVDVAVRADGGGVRVWACGVGAVKEWRLRGGGQRERGNELIRRTVGCGESVPWATEWRYGAAPPEEVERVLDSEGSVVMEVVHGHEDVQGRVHLAYEGVHEDEGYDSD